MAPTRTILAVVLILFLSGCASDRHADAVANAAATCYEAAAAIEQGVPPALPCAAIKANAAAICAAEGRRWPPSATAAAIK